MNWVHNASPEIDAQSRWPIILGICIALTALMTTTVGMRLYVRAFMIKSMGIDDYVMLFSCVSIYEALSTRRLTKFRSAASFIMGYALDNQGMD